LETNILEMVKIVIFLTALSISMIPRFGFSYILSVIVSGALLVLLFITHSYWVLPVGMLSLLCGESLYSKKFYLPFLILFLIVVSYAWFLDLNHIRIIDAALIIGFTVAFLGHDRMLSFSKTNDNQKGRSISREVPRDLVQIEGGILIIIGIYFLGIVMALFVLTILILFYFATINFFKDRKDLKTGMFLNSFERENTPLGIGASWFAIGILITVSIVHYLPFIILVIFAVTFGDSIATIVGTKLKGPKLFFNKKKSYSGFFSMFIVTAILGYYLIGFSGILFAIVAVFSEALSTFPIDDNFAIPVFMTVIHKILPLILSI